MAKGGWQEHESHGHEITGNAHKIVRRASPRGPRTCRAEVTLGIVVNGLRERKAWLWTAYTGRTSHGEAKSKAEAKRVSLRACGRMLRGD